MSAAEITLTFDNVNPSDADIARIRAACPRQYAPRPVHVAGYCVTYTGTISPAGTRRRACYLVQCLTSLPDGIDLLETARALRR